MARAIGLIAFSIVLAATAAAQRGLNRSAEARIEKTQFALNERFGITIRAEGSTVDEPEVPTVDGVEISPTPASRQIQIGTIIDNGRATQTSSRTWVFAAEATKVGEHTIPPFKVRIDGRIYQTEPLKITVTKQSGQLQNRQSKPARPHQRRGTRRQPKQQSNNQNGGAPQLEDAVFLESYVDKQDVYQGELVLLTLRMGKLRFPGVSIDANNTGSPPPPPPTEGFYTGPEQKERNYEDIDGHPFIVAQHQQALFPTDNGDMTIGTWDWNGVVSGWTNQGLQRIRLNLETDPIDIAVKPLPDRPDDFKGAVGAYDLRAQLLDSDVKQGVPTQLEIRVMGVGNPDAIGAPDLPEIPGIQIGEPAFTTNYPNQNDWLYMVRTFTYDLTPVRVGEVEIPPVEYTYFDPELGDYRTKKTKTFRLHVKPSGEQTQLVVRGGTQQERQTVEVLGEDLRPIVTAVDSLGRVRGGTVFNVAAGAGAPVAFAVFFAVVRQRRRLEEDPDYARHIYAGVRGRKRLKHLLDEKDPTDALYRTLTGYLADKFGTPGEGMTSDDARAILEDCGAGAEVTEKVIRVLRACERERYAAAKLQPQELEALRDAALDAMDRLETFTRERRR